MKGKIYNKQPNFYLYGGVKRKFIEKEQKYELNKLFFPIKFIS